MVARHRHMTGKLNEHPLAELIREIVSEKLSGSLRLEHERVKTAIYFDRGELVFATSNLRAHRLTESLRRWRVIKDEQLLPLAQAGKTDAEVARSLVAAGLLTEETLKELRARQVNDVLKAALLWTEGEWSFNPRVRLAEDVRVTLEIEELLLEAARRYPAQLTPKRFPYANEKIEPKGDAPPSLDLLPVEAFVLSRIDIPMRLNELLAISGLPEAETLHALYGLALGGFLLRDSWPRAFTPEEVAKAAAASQATATAQPAPNAPTESTEVAKPEALVDEGQELAEVLERVKRATNHYQVLGIARNADQDTVKRTYHRLARRFHPDRFHQEPALYRQVEDAFAKIAQAYETLKDKTSRAAYELKGESGKERQAERPQSAPAREQTTQAQAAKETPPATAQNAPKGPATGKPNGEESFQRGVAALKMGNMALALNAFAEAAHLEPKVARYRAQYGQALATSIQMRHRAETELQAAIMLEPANISYRIMLASLYQKLGLARRAQGEVERALALDPKNAEAQQLLTELKAEQSAR